MSGSASIIVRDRGRVDYSETFGSMQAFTSERTPYTTDEIWIVEHAPVYTLGLKARHKQLAGNGIPIVYSDRGGDVTYHGPGQLVVYLLLDLQRRGIGVRTLVCAIEEAIVDMLHTYDVRGERRAGAPGVYVAQKKIAALGLRVRHGACYHGLAFNLDMDLTPFAHIDPCGYADLEVTHLAAWVQPIDRSAITERLINQLVGQLGYTQHPQKTFTQDAVALYG